MREGFPEEFITRLSGQKSVNTDSLLEALASDSPVSIRVNPAKWTGIPDKGEKIPWCNTGYWLPERPVFTLDPLYHAGCYYVQEASSMFLEVLFRAVGGDKGGLRILDMCASPGGKTTHISSLAGPGSIVIANESVRTRIGALVENTIRWGAPNTVVSNNDPDDFGELSSYFDIAIVDAPCSGEGMFRRSDVRTQWSGSGCELCADRQKRILRAAWQSLKPGGYLLYSTCTFNPAENELNIKWLTGNHDARIVRIDTSEYTGVTEVGSDGFAGYAFYPDKIRGEGFFIAAVQKMEVSESLGVERWSPKPGRIKDTIPSRVRNLIVEEGGCLQKFDDLYYYTPVTSGEMAMLEERLRLIRKGTEVCRLKRERIIPSHDLSMSLIFKEGFFPKAELSYNDAIRYLRKDSIAVSSKMPEGWFLVTFSGVRLGFMNNIGNRLNNYYPPAFRIRMDAKGGGSNVLVDT